MSRAAMKERSRSLQYNTLILNADFWPLSTFPVSIKPARKAIENYIKRKVDIVDDWGVMVRSSTLTVPVPKVVVLRQFAPIYGEPKFCRRSILVRDKFRCQYCGQEFPSQELTYDHVIPRSLGGKTTWTNIVTACLRCNAAKANSLPHYSGRKGVVRPGKMRPLKEPRRPTNAELLRAGLQFLPNDVRDDFGSYLYWHTELRA